MLQVKYLSLDLVHGEMLNASNYLSFIQTMIYQLTFPMEILPLYPRKSIKFTTNT